MFVGNVIVNVPEELFAKILSFTAAWCVVLTILVDTPAVPVVDMYLPIFFVSFVYTIYVILHKIKQYLFLYQLQPHLR